MESGEYARLEKKTRLRVFFSNREFERMRLVFANRL